MFVHYGIKPTQEKPGSDQLNQLNLTLPVLGDLSVENLPPRDSLHKKTGSFHLWENDAFLLGFTKTRIERASVNQTAQAIYREIFELTKGAFLYRVWNYLPELNSGEGDQEQYKQFCEGRSNAFHEAFGEENLEFMPAGSCVGIDGDELVIYFLAGSKCPDHHENSHHPE
jgi:hypothetical protein